MEILERSILSIEYIKAFENDMSIFNLKIFFIITMIYKFTERL